MQGGVPAYRPAVRRFSTFAAIDWSGAVGARQPGIAVALADASGGPPRLVRPGHIWSREDVADWLAEAAAAGTAMLVGADFSFGLPHHDAGSYFPELAIGPGDMPALWRLVDDVCRHEAHLGAGPVLADPELRRHFRHGRGDVGDLFIGPIGRLRVVEAHQRATRQAASVSCFNLVGAAQVGKASLTGMRLLARLHPALPVWPLDPVPATGPMLAEIYTSIAARAAGLAPGRSKVRDGAALDAALAALNSPPTGHAGAISDHAADALLTAAWLRAVTHDPALWRPAPLTRALARTEGWTLGIV